MNLLWLLLRRSRRLVIVSALAGAVGGVTAIVLIALIQRELASEPTRSATIASAFFALCLLSAAARIISQLGMVKLGQKAVSELSLQLVERTLNLQLRAFETINRSALLAVLTEDIGLVASAIVGVPQLCINVPIVVACLVYIAWLSPMIFAFGVVFAGGAIGAYVILSARGSHCLSCARDTKMSSLSTFAP